MEKDKNWLKRQIEEASKEIEEWPQWMKETIKEEKPKDSAYLK
jgi:hypothetical protein